MQTSSSFSDVRIGKSRPANLLSIRTQPSESLPWPSPSFDVTKGAGGDNAAIEADPDRPSTQIRSSSSDSFPPTPLTATYKPILLPAVETASHQQEKKTVLKLPGVNDLLGHTPPDSVQRGTIPLPSVYGQVYTEASPIRNEPAAIRSLLPASASKTGLFQGSTAEWTHDNASFARIDRRPIAPRPNMFRCISNPVSPDSFRRMPTSNSVQGLGLDLGEETPRLGVDGNWSMMTPVPNRMPGLPGAPNLSSAQSGRFADVEQTSPIKPALRNWNTNLAFGYQTYHARPFPVRSFTDTPASAAMERERTIEIEGGLPFERKTWGLALSTDDGRTYRRGDAMYRQDSTMISASHRALVQAGPPTPKAAAAAATQNTIMAPASASKIRSHAITASPSVTSSATKRPHHSATTGLTPHVYKTRLTPTYVSASKNKACKMSPDGTVVEVESPSLKMKSKQRSEQLREHAEYIANQAHLPSDVPCTSSSSPTSPIRDGNFTVDPSVQQNQSKTAPPSVTPRDKKTLAVRKVDHNKQQMDSISPWGVFGINTSDDAWQPLGHPTLSKAMGKLDLADKVASTDMERIDSGVALKKPRKAATNTELGGSPPRRLNRYQGGEDKENDVFGSSMTNNKGGRKVSTILPPSPTKTTTSFGQRRLVNIR